LDSTSESLLRPRNGDRAEVTSVELFFDLVFVITVTQISHALLANMTWLGALEAGLMLVATWWAWIDTAWVTNWLDPQRWPVRVMLFALMAIGLVMTSSVPKAFGDRGLSFALSFVAFQLGRTIFSLWAMRSDPTLSLNFRRLLAWYSFSSLFWAAGGFAEGELRLGLWIVAVILENVGPAMGFWLPRLGRSDTRQWTIDGEHMAERSGLFVMIALGESLFATGIGFTELEWTPDVVLALVALLLQTIAMWSIYFGQHARLASDAIARSSNPGAVARRAYTYVPILLNAGIIVSAVGDDLTIAHPDGDIETASALVLIGGPLLFLVGALLFKIAVFARWSWPRVIGLVALIVLSPVAGALTHLALSALTTAVMVALAIYEAFWFARHPEGSSEDVPISFQE
jgi:low temperature requirement protein LtrA